MASRDARAAETGQRSGLGVVSRPRGRPGREDALHGPDGGRRPAMFLLRRSVGAAGSPACGRRVLAIKHATAQAGS